MASPLPSPCPCTRPRPTRASALPVSPVDPDAQNLDGASAPALLDAAALLGFNAFNITHRASSPSWSTCNELSDAARALGAVNCVVIREDGTFYGDNTDYSGFIAGLKRGLPQVAEDPARLEHGCCGAGGAERHGVRPVPPGGAPPESL